MKAAVITVSDKGARFEREDKSGPALIAFLRDKKLDVAYYVVIPDEIDLIQSEIEKLADAQMVELVVTTGGTGFAARDVTPEATRAAVEKLVPGIPEAMRTIGAKRTPNAILSRAIAGIRGNTLIVNLPGSPRGAVESLESVWDALSHGLDVLTGVVTEHDHGKDEKQV